jgi:transcriptional regulator with XRE-family HTH domain
MPDDLARPRRVVEREAVRLTRLDANRVAEELRELRLGLNVSQAAVARIVGVSQSVISDLERGDPTVGLDVRRRAAIALGADLRVAVYPGATPMLHDAGHAWIIARLLRRRHQRWRADVEARVPGPGRSSTDVRLSDARTIVLIEVETHLRRWEATVRRSFENRERVREAAPIGTNVFAVLCLPPTRHHRQLISGLDLRASCVPGPRGPHPAGAGGRNRLAGRRDPMGSRRSPAVRPRLSPGPWPGPRRPGRRSGARRG